MFIHTYETTVLWIQLEVPKRLHNYSPSKLIPISMMALFLCSPSLLGVTASVL